jgi:hypothetical protein
MQTGYNGVSEVGFQAEGAVMKIKVKRLSTITLAVSAALVACSLPVRTPTPFVFPTPNRTMTALFAQVPVGASTATLPPVLTATLTGGHPTMTAAPLASSTLEVNTATLAASRPGPAIVAPYLSSPPKIDGDWSDWSTTAYPATFVVFGASQWSGPADLEASFRVGWDLNNLYLAGKVKDDRYVQVSHGADIYKGDSLEILLDSDLAGDLTNRELDDDDYQLGISPGYETVGNSPEAYLWYPEAEAGSQSGVKIGAIGSSGVYRVEAAIPWSLFAITPTNGAQFGFVFSASDDDTPGVSEQQKMVSNDRGRQLDDPTTWGTLILKR